MSLSTWNAQQCEMKQEQSISVSWIFFFLLYSSKSMQEYFLFTVVNVNEKFTHRSCPGSLKASKNLKGRIFAGTTSPVE